MTRAERIELAARELLAAMDRQYGQPYFSFNVQASRERLAELVKPARNERDRSRMKGEAA